MNPGGRGIKIEQKRKGIRLSARKRKLATCLTHASRTLGIEDFGHAILGKRA